MIELAKIAEVTIITVAGIWGFVRIVQTKITQNAMKKISGRL
jgi:hypothetical protein